MTVPPLDEVLALLPPALAGLAILVAGAWADRRGTRASWAAAAAVVGVAGAYLWMFVRARGLPAWPPRQAVEREFLAVAAAGLLALVAAVAHRGVFLRVPVHVLCAVGTVTLAVGGIASPSASTGVVVAVSVGAVASFLLLDLAAIRPAPAFCASCAFALGATGQVLFLFGSAFLAQLAGTVAILMGGAAAAGLFLKNRFPAPATIPLAAITTALSVDGALYMYEPPPAMALVLLAAGPIAPLIPHALLGRRLGAVTMTAIDLATSLAVTGTGFYLAWRVAPEPYL